MRPLFELSAQNFLDAQRNDLAFQAVFDRILDEINELLEDPAVDGENKLVFPIPFDSTLSYRIYWGRQFFGRSFWYIYEPDYSEEVLRVHNIGDAGIETPFLSRR